MHLATNRVYFEEFNSKKFFNLKKIEFLLILSCKKISEDITPWRRLKNQFLSRFVLILGQKSKFSETLRTSELLELGSRNNLAQHAKFIIFFSQKSLHPNVQWMWQEVRKFVYH